MASVTHVPASRSLADDLRNRDAGQLRSLLRARPDLALPPPKDTTELAMRAGSAASVARVLDDLDAATLGVLEVLAAGDEPLSVEAIVGGIPAARTERVVEIIAILRDLALAWGPDDGLRLVRSARLAFGAHPGALGPPMASARRAVAELAGDAARMREIVASGPPQAQELLEHVVWIDPLVLPPGATDMAAAWLAERHILQPLDDDALVLPREIGLSWRGGVVLRDGALDPPAMAGAISYDPDDVDRTAAAEALVLLEQVDVLATEWSVRPPTALRTGGLAARELVRVADLLGTSPDQAELVVDVAKAVALVAADGGEPARWSPTSAYDAWTELAPAHQWAHLVRAWLAADRSIGAGAGSAKTARPGARPPVETGQHDGSFRRRLVLRALATSDPGSTPEYPDLAEALRYLAPRRAGALPDGAVAQILAEAEWLGVTGRGALSSFGRILATDETSSDSAAQRLTTALPPHVDSFVVQADLTIVAPGPLDRPVRLELNRCADVESRGLASVYRVSAHSLRRAFDAGATAPDIKAFIASHSSTPVPQALEVLVDDVARRHGTLVVGGATAYIRCTDSAVLSGLVADSRLSALRLSAISDTVLASGSPPATVLDQLRATGHAPAAAGADGMVVILPPTVHRSAAPPALPTPGISDTVLVAIVRALTTEPGAADEPTVVATTSPDEELHPGFATTVHRLRAAVERGAAVTISYADAAGTQTDRVIEPLSLDGGFLTAYDLGAAQVRSFTVSRISGVH